MVPVAGCLSEAWETWQEKGAEQWVVEVLREGYRIPFSTPPLLAASPIPFDSYSPRSLKGQALDLEVQTMLSKGAIELAPQDPGFYSRLFVVAKASGGWRPVIDLSPLNRSFIKTKFRMETNRTIMSAIRKDDWMISFDLQDTYFQIPVHQKSLTHLVPGAEGG